MLGLGVWLLASEMARQRSAERGAEVVNILPGVAQRIQNFHRVKIEDGRKVWEVSAREARYREGDGTVRVEDPVVQLFFEDGREISLRGSSGVVFLDGRELRRIEVEGGIAVTVGDYVLSTEQATYEAERDVVVAPGAVHIQGGGLDLRGEQMEVEVATQRLRLAARVHMTLWPKT
jgi:LPS export ABC transporter protein LptC